MSIQPTKVIIGDKEFDSVEEAVEDKKKVYDANKLTLIIDGVSNARN